MLAARLRVLGGLDLRDADGAELDAVLAQPKRAALLAYLALATPAGMSRRDTLLATFWPESDQARARAALSRAVHYLRQALGAEAIVSRGNEELGVAPERIWCDAVAFQSSIAAGDAEAALSLYRGDLMAGVFLTGAPGFERWVEDERARLREAARAAAARLVEAGRRSGRLAEAIRWARRGLKIVPDDEGCLRELLGLLDDAGDRAGALHAFELFAHRLKDDLDLEPSGETQAVVEALRAGRRVVPQPPPAKPAPALSGPDRPAPAAAAPAPVATADRGRRPVVVVTLALTAVAAAMAWLSLNRTDRAAPAAELRESAVAILPFDVTGDAGFAYLGEGMVDLLTARLAGSGAVRPVEPRALLSLLSGQGTLSAGVSPGREAAAQLGARYHVTGTVAAGEGRLELQAMLHDALSDSASIARAAVSGPVERLGELVDELGRQLLARLSPLRAAGSAPGAAPGQLTTSLLALRAYLDGNRAMRAGRYPAALEAFTAAVRADTGFVLAFYQLANAAHWSGRVDLARQATLDVLRYEDRLSARQRLFLHAWAQQYAAPAEAESAYGTILADHPDDVEAWYQLGEVRFHWGPVLGRPLQAAREAFERVVFFESDNVSALIHLSRLAGTDGDARALDSLAARALALGPAEFQAIELRMLRALARTEPTDPAALLQAGRYLDDGQLISLLRSAAAHGDDLAGSAAFAYALARLERAAARTVFWLMAANIEAARGRWRAADAALAAVEALYPARAAEFRAVLALHPTAPVGEADLRAARDALPLPTPGEFPIGASDRFLGANSIYPPRAWYLLAHVSARLGDRPAAERYVAELERFSDGGQVDQAYAREYATVVRAELARRAGDPEAALAMLGELRSPPDHVFPELGSYPRAHARWLRAELLTALGRSREALEMYASFPDPLAHDVAYVTAASLRRAELREQLGDREAAADLYGRVLEQWAEADTGLAPWTAAARRGLTRTAGEPGSGSGSR